MNFFYDYWAYYMISVYLEVGVYEKVKLYFQILVECIVDELDYYNFFDLEILESSF